MFPNYKKIKWIPFIKVKDGWENLGKVSYTAHGDYYRYICHNICGDIANVGKENGMMFLYCKRCMCKLEKKGE